MDYKIRQNFFWIIFLLIIPTYIIGVGVTEIFVLILTIFFFLNLKNFNPIKDKKFLFLISFSIYLFLNSSFQLPFKHYDLLISSIFHFRFVFFSFSIFFLLKFLIHSKNLTDKKYLNLIIMIYFFILLDSLVQFFLGQNLLGYQLFNNYRVSGIFGSELILGSYLIKSLPFIIWLFFYTNLSISENKYFIVIFLSLYFIIIFLSGERTSLALLFMMIFLFFIFLKVIRKTIFISFVVFISFICITSFIKIGKTEPHNRIFFKTFNQLTNQTFISDLNNKDFTLTDQSFFDKIKKNLVIFSKNHQGHYILGISLFKDSPYFGTGAKGFRSYCRKSGYEPDIGVCTTHPHNILIQLLAETGLVGLFYYLFSIIFIFRSLIKSQEKNIPSNDKNCFVVISVSILINLFPFLPGGNFFNNWISVVNYFYVGLYLFYLERVFLPDKQILNNKT